MRKAVAMILIMCILLFSLLPGCTEKQGGNEKKENGGDDDGEGNEQPHASFWFPRSVFVGELTTFDGSNSTDAEDSIVRYTWNFGDGTNASGMIVQHSYNRSGYFAVGLEVEDAGGRRDTEHDSISVSEREVVDPEMQAPSAGMVARKIENIPGRVRYVVTVVNVTGENTRIVLINYTILDGVDLSIVRNGTLVNASDGSDGAVAYTTLDDVLSEGDIFTIDPAEVPGLADGDIFRLDFGPTGDVVGACLLMNPE